jgi:hypothetical protein
MRAYNDAQTGAHAGAPLQIAAQLISMVQMGQDRVGVDVLAGENKRCLRRRVIN